MDVPNSIARYSKTGTWIDWVYGRSKGLFAYMVKDVYMDILAIISKFLGARWMNLDLDTTGTSWEKLNPIGTVPCR